MLMALYYFLHRLPTRMHQFTVECAEDERMVPGLTGAVKRSLPYSDWDVKRCEFSEFAQRLMLPDRGRADMDPSF